MSLSHSPRIVTNGLVCCLDANDPKSYNGSGSTWFDRSGNTNSTILNSPVFEDSCFSLNGTNQYASVSNVIDFSIQEAFTAEIWAKSDNSVWNNNGYLVSRRNQFIIHPQAGSTDVRFYYNNGGWPSISMSVDDITVWHQYVVSANTSTFKGFLDGINKVSAGGLSSLTSDTGVIEIGKDDNLARYFDGKIACVRLYDRALTPKEVLQNYNATKSRFSL